MNLQDYNNPRYQYVLQTDEIAGAANKLMFDLWNGSNTGTNPNRSDIIILGIWAEAETDAAVSGVVSARFDIYRTTTKGTGGTTNSYNAPAANAINISSIDSDAPSLSGTTITARSAPTAGASKSAWLWSTYVFPEETNAGAVLAGRYQILPDTNSVKPFVLKPGNGLVVQQGSVASVNNYVFRVIFAIADNKV